ncbi:uncharacterized protein C2845_PM08G19120 [Panicum miliaceum]|uniref:F-box associated domain-containing protein n=1 Tax=Panicum miliaceum TaxID=4540 RepID=A0A3L6R377_PANMI|nr:uncharacterized protein C2845_PM08G19120 [Panicum miliaceum]
MPWFDDGARASGCVYWVVHDWELDFEHILVLDSQTKKFSTINLPCSHMCEKYDSNIKVVRSEGDRDLRIVAMAWSSCKLHFWRRDRSRSAKRTMVERGCREVFECGWGGSSPNGRCSLV